MSNIIKTPYKLLLSSILCATLAACGSGGGSDTSAISSGGLNGIVITSNNYQSAFRTGVTGSFKLALKLMFAGSIVDTSRLILSSNIANTLTYACDNQSSGTLQVTDLGNNTKEWVFDDCQVGDNATGTHYQGIAVVETIVNSGNESNIGSNLDDWNITQYLAFSNFIQTYPVVNGSSSRANGNIVLETYNDVVADVNSSTMRSTNLMLDSTNVSDVTTNYSFSDIFYDLKEDLSDESLQSNIDFTANITGIGDIELMTNPVLQFDNEGTLLSGTGYVTTGNSKAQMSATGNDTVSIALDADNDGMYETSIPTTWCVLLGDGGCDVQL